ncbi:MAG: HlyD family efflux transporter periplasmic adaptor subunit [Rhodobiaceae bacterium]|nr:HlyD family efflux transporter periplasmic adaptor subunit [Rhodobiaceae bacterium]
MIGAGGSTQQSETGPAELSQRGAEAGVPVLEAALWKRLGEAQSLDALAATWLAIQCSLIGSVRQGVLVLEAERGRARTVRAAWPEGSDVTRLAACAELAVAQNRGVVQKLKADRGESGGAQIAYPVVVDERHVGAVAIEVGDDRGPQLRAAANQLQWGCAWIRDHLHRQEAEARTATVGTMSAALDLLAASLEEERFVGACRTCVTELALSQRCERVSVGFVRRDKVRVASISHTAQFGKKMNLVLLLGAAMDEAVDQQAVILYPPNPDETLVTRAHAELADAHGCGAIMTVPLFVKDAFVGAFTFERGRDEPFDQDTVDFLECVASVLGPILYVKRREDRWLITKAGLSVWTQIRRLLGPGYIGRKLAVAALLAAGAFGYFATDTYRVTSDAVIEGTVQRAIVAPFNGFIQDAAVRAGDTVKAGDVVASLDQRDLVLERLKWVTERDKKVFEYERAIGERNRADAKIANAEKEEAEAQIKLIDEQLQRATMRAPFDGLVVSGDLSQSVGAAVQRGQLLFEIAPLNAYRVMLNVDESQIGEIAEGETGNLVVTSLPDTAFDIAVRKITPVAEVQDGRNTFRVEAALIENSPRLRPGMKGVAKVQVGERRVVWIWSRAALNWLRLAAWRWFG